MSTNEPTVNIKSFLGIRNTGQSRRLLVGSLATAQNVDIDDEGAVISRQGYVSSLTLTSVTAAFTPLHEQFSYIVDNGVLYQVDAGLNKYSLGNVSTSDTHWAEAGNDVFMSTGYMVRDKELLPWRISPPDQLRCQATVGNLKAGIYQLTATVTAADGRESASCNITMIELDDDSGIYIPNASGKNIYMTDANGEVFYLVGSGINVIESTAYLSIQITLELLQNETVPEDIELIEYYDAAMYVTQYDSENNVTIVMFSKPYWYHVFDFFQDYFQVPGQVRSMVEANGNLVFGTDKAIYAYNGEALQQIAKYGVPMGHIIAKSPDGDVLMWTNRGVLDCNALKNVTEDKVSLAPGYVCSAAIMETNGISKFIVLTDGDGTANNTV